MGIADDIISARDCGVVRCGLSSHTSPSIPELAAEFGLADDPASYKEIDVVAARRLIQLLLSQDMAYNSDIVPPALAAELTERFLDQFGAVGVRFYTNGTFHLVQGPRLTWSGVSWDPMTQATFDTGVLIVGPQCSGCLWIEDED
jgi:hypothetical protein